jgi:hypothetical protein
VPDDTEHVRDDLIVRHSVGDKRAEAVSDHARNRQIPLQHGIRVVQPLMQLLHSIGPHRTATSTKRSYAMCVLPALPDMNDCMLHDGADRVSREFVRLVSAR